MKILALITLILCFGATISRAQVRTVTPLELRIDIPQNLVCVGEHLEIDMKLTNKGKKPIVVDTGSLGYETTFTWTEESLDQQESGMLSSIADHGPDYKPSFIILGHAEAYQKKGTVDLDNANFKSGGKFRMTITYGQFSKSVFESIPVWRGTVDSNEVPLTIEICSK